MEQMFMILLKKEELLHGKINLISKLKLYRCDRVLVRCKDPIKDKAVLSHYKMVESIKNSDHK